ncbi:MAG: SufE family protein [Lachnospiraceae bacterium]|jgi:cysteine desulfuration protein SufE
MWETEKSIKDDLLMIGDDLLRIEFVIQCGKAFDGMSEEKKRERNLIKDCQMKTWLDVFWDGDILKLNGDSESLIVKGAISFICEIYNKRERREIRDYKCTLMEMPEFRNVFSPDQRRGIESILRKIY